MLNIDELEAFALKVVDVEVGPGVPPSNNPFEVARKKGIFVSPSGSCGLITNDPAKFAFPPPKTPSGSTPAAAAATVSNVPPKDRK